ncbi:MAG TPA: hypothetical protein DCQ06_00890 [Myxococcales bacterium]|nr:hypothetical protein [Myxococcales bacterium]HAN30128.1 hypothetical protein [Myxococcales bacterium]
MSDLKLGVDVGGSRIKFGVVQKGRVIERALVPMKCSDPQTLVQLISQTAHRLCAQGGYTFEEIGIGVAAVMTQGGHEIIQSPNMPWLNGAPIRSMLQSKHKAPVFCENDANCVGWGEAVAGAGSTKGDQICLALGTGVGGSLILNGMLFRGVRGRGAELGHINIDPNGPLCGCGGRGCLEQYASKTGLLRMLKEFGSLTACDDPIVELFNQARAMDPVARHIVRIAGRALGQGLANLNHLFGVQTVILAGGIAGAADLLLPHLHQRTQQLKSSALTVQVGTLGNDAGVIGAAQLSGAG